MMGRSRLLTIDCCVVAALAFGLIGCSVHPLPEDVARVTTVDIVERMRCEAKEGLAEAARHDPRDPQGLHTKRIVEGTTIGLEFEFVMAEDNKAAGGVLIFERPGSSGSFTLSLNSSLNSDHGHENNRTRKNTRIFRVVEDLKDLYGAKCAGNATHANLLYPITGNTGMAEVVRTYIELEKLTDIGATGAGKETVVFSDALEFTTTFEMGATPDLRLDAVVGSLRLTRASVTGSALRRDAHSVTVVLARDDKHVDVDLPEGPGGVKKTMKFDIAKVRDKRLQTALAQRGALARNRIALELQRRRNLREDEVVVERVLLGLSAP